METHNFLNLEQYKEEERSQIQKNIFQNSLHNSKSPSPETVRPVHSEQQPSIIFQLWLRENLEDLNSDNLDVAEYLQNYISDQSENHPIQRAFSLDLRRNRVLLDRYQQCRKNNQIVGEDLFKDSLCFQHQALIDPIFPEDVSISLSSSMRSLSKISEESQVLYSKDSVQLTKTARNSIQKESTTFLKQETSQSLRFINTSSIIQSLEEKALAICDLPILISEKLLDPLLISEKLLDSDIQLECEKQLEDDDLVPVLKRSITSPKKGSKSKISAINQLGTPGGIILSQSQQIPSPKSSSRRKKTLRNSTINYEEIYYNIYEKGIVRKAFVKTSKRKIAQTYVQQITRNSLLSFDMKRSVVSKTQNFVQAIKVSYFTSKIIKKFTVPKEMNAGEFIHKVLRTYRYDKSLDQDLLKYPTNPLAYRLESMDEYLIEEEEENDTHTYKYKKQQINKDNGRDISMNQRKTSSELSKDHYACSDSELEEMMDRIVLAPEAPINFSLIYLMENDTMIQKLQADFSKGITIVQIEDPLLTEFYYLKIYQQNMTDLIDQINQDYPGGLYNQQDHCLRLKYPCLGYAEQVLPDQLSALALPIHQLEIIKLKEFEFNFYKPQLQFQKAISYSDKSLNNQSEFLKLSQIMSPNNKTLNLQRDQFDEAHRMKMYPTLYSYEEFDMLRVVGQKVEPVIVAIDFFDFYYIHKDIRTKSNKSLRKRINHYFKKVLQLLLEDYNKINNLQKKFPLQNITEYKLENQQLKIKYDKNENDNKNLIFEIDPLFIKSQKTDDQEENQKQIVEKGKYKLQAIYGKITFLMQQHNCAMSL